MTKASPPITPPTIGPIGVLFAVCALVSRTQKGKVWRGGLTEDCDELCVALEIDVALMDVALETEEVGGIRVEAF
jgi:hypothetical protein